MSIANKPRLAHTPSKQSLAVSDEYYSFSDHGSDVSAESDRTTIVRQKTPPSHLQSPNTGHHIIQQHDSHLPMRLLENMDGSKTPRATRFDERTIMRKPAPVQSNTKVWRASINEVSPPTPGVDDTPYIQFAIDQLTRDEELLGRRRQRAGSDASSLNTHGQSPIVVHTISSTQAPGNHSMDQETAQEGIPMRDTTDSQRDLTSGYRLYPTVAQSLTPFTATSNALPTNIAYDAFHYPKLNFLPQSQSYLSILGLIACCVLMITALIFCSVWTSRNNGLLQYDGVRTRRYFLFEFLPQILASFIILWLMVIQTSVQRILPFSLLASEQPNQHDGALRGAKMFPTNYLKPNLSFLTLGEPLLGASFILFWLCLFTVPLQSSLFQTRLYTISGQGVWKWTVVQPIAWILIFLYFFLIVGLALVLLSFAQRTTGLKWDPVSLADIIALAQGSNHPSILDSPDSASFDRRQLRNSRLGYWITSSRPNEVFYGIRGGHPFASSHQSRKIQTSIRAPDHPSENTTCLDLESQRATLQSSTVQHDWVPWFLRDAWVVAWIVIAFVLMIAFIVVSFVHQAVRIGFLPLLSAPTTSLSFSPANFLYSFLPSLIGMILFLAWQSIDMYFRALQPFATLTKVHGATAEESILLDYTASLPIQVTIRAIIARHYKVAWISFISILSITLPILGGGIFTAQFFVDKQQVREAAYMPAYYALVVFVVIYCLSFLIIWPTRKRHLPHDISTLAGVVSFAINDSLRNEAAFQRPNSKTDLVTRLLSTPGGEKATPRYRFEALEKGEGIEGWGIKRIEGLHTRDMTT